MPALPTLTVPQATADRLLAAFAGRLADDGVTALTPTAAYKQWLRTSLIDHVVAVESQASNSTLEGGIPLT